MSDGGGSLGRSGELEGVGEGLGFVRFGHAADEAVGAGVLHDGVFGKAAGDDCADTGLEFAQLGECLDAPHAAFDGEIEDDDVEGLGGGLGDLEEQEALFAMSGGADGTAEAAEDALTEAADALVVVHEQDAHPGDSGQ